MEYLGHAVLEQFQRSAESGKQYRDDAIYVEGSIEAFNSRVERLREAMEEVAGSIANIPTPSAAQRRACIARQDRPKTWLRI